MRRRRRWRLSSRVLLVVAGLVFLFELTPILVIMTSSLTTTNYTTFPPVGLTLRWYNDLVQKGTYNSAIVRTLITAVVAVTVSTAFGVPTALALVRFRFRGRNLLNMATLSPLIVPDMITAVALLQFFSVAGVVPSLYLLIVGHITLTFPYTVRTVSASLHGINLSLEEAARNLGASPLCAFRTITLPLIKPGVVAGGLFAFIVSVELMVVSMFLSEVNTVPVEMYWRIRFNEDPTVAAMAALMVLSLIPLMWMIDRTVGLSTFAGVGQT